MKYVFLIVILTFILFLVACVTPITDYELCNTIDCAPSVDIEIENAT